MMVFDTWAGADSAPDADLYSRHEPRPWYFPDPVPGDPAADSAERLTQVQNRQWELIQEGVPEGEAWRRAYAETLAWERAHPGY